MRSKTNKRLAAVVMTCAMAISAVTAISANAKSLKDSFSSGTSVNFSSSCWWSSDKDYWTKSCWASTNGYYKYHYVRAMVGTVDNAWADTGRCYSYGNIKRTATTDPLLCSGWSWEFPTGHAYYGN